MFIQRTDRGREYFQGDLETMKKIMAEVVPDALDKMGNFFFAKKKLRMIENHFL